MDWAKLLKIEWAKEQDVRTYGVLGREPIESKSRVGAAFASYHANPCDMLEALVGRINMDRIPAVASPECLMLVDWHVEDARTLWRMRLDFRRCETIGPREDGTSGFVGWNRLYDGGCYWRAWDIPGLIDHMDDEHRRRFVLQCNLYAYAEDYSQEIAGKEVSGFALLTCPGAQ
jgi:hypothetical protein